MSFGPATVKAGADPIQRESTPLSRAMAVALTASQDGRQMLRLSTMSSVSTATRMGVTSSFMHSPVKALSMCRSPSGILALERRMMPATTTRSWPSVLMTAAIPAFMMAAWTPATAAWAGCLTASTSASSSKAIPPVTSMVTET